MSENPVAVTQALLPVIQADRDAAADYAREHWLWPAPHVEGIRIGSEAWDAYHLTQAFARHRLAGLEREADGAPGGGMGEALRIGDKVEVIGEYEADFRGQDWWVAGIRVHDSGEGLDVTLAEQWPIPNRHWREYRGQTDGFRPEQLRVIEAALTKPASVSDFAWPGKLHDFMPGHPHRAALERLVEQCWQLAEATPKAGENDPLWWERQSSLRDASVNIADFLRQIDATAAAQPASVSGEVVVPREPTEAMLDEACGISIAVYPTNIPSGWTALNHDEARELWAAMLAAAPEAATPPREWFPHLDYAGEPMREGEFRDPPEEAPSAALLRAPSNSVPDGCHCKDICAAPVIMGRQQPCRRAGGIPGQPAPKAPEAVAATPSGVDREALDVLADLSSYVGAGIGDGHTTAAEYDRRIRWGIDHLCSVASTKENGNG